MITREEAIALLNEQYETCKRIYDCSADQRKSYPNVPQFMEALGMALSALRPVSREQVEKAEWIWSTWDVYICSSCGEKTHVDECMGTPIYNFCPFCMAPMTDEAVQMVMERLEATNDKLEESC